EAAAVTNGIALLKSGTTFQGLEAILYGSQEYYIRAGGTNSTFLASLYQGVLGRPIDSGAATAGQAALDGGYDRSALALFLINSPEGSMRTVQGLYNIYLRRLPTFSELTANAAALSGGSLSYTDLIAALVGSQEYFSGL